MDEGRKRVLLIAASILAARKLAQYEAGPRVPATICAIDDAIQWAERIISDNGPQFIARDFKEFIRISGMTHVRTSPYYPESNGKLERWHKSLKSECIRPLTPLTLEDARRLIQRYVDYYNGMRLNSAIGYVTPQDMLAGRQAQIHADRDRKLEQARQQRQLRRQRASAYFNGVRMTLPGETEAGSAGTQPC